MNKLLLDALHCQNDSGKVPIWIMRQAGRYLPTYRAIRKKHSFQSMYRNAELASEITLLPLHEFDLDAAIVFSDILVVAEALGMELHFVDQKGPVFPSPLSHVKEIDLLAVPQVTQSLGYVAETIKILKRHLTVPLIGFCGSPFTIASYMIEGQSSKDFKKTKQWLFQQPDAFQQLLEKISETTIQYLLMQISAGVDAIQIFESWGGQLLAYTQFSAFSVHYVAKIANAVRHTGIPVIYFSKGSAAFAQEMTQSNVHALSLDWSCNLSHIRKIVGSQVALQGNLDPHVLYSPISTIQQEAHSLLTSMRLDPGYVCNLGHGILPDTPMDAVKALVEKVKSYETSKNR